MIAKGRYISGDISSRLEDISIEMTKITPKIRLPEISGHAGDNFNTSEDIDGSFDMPMEKNSCRI